MKTTNLMVTNVSLWVPGETCIGIEGSMRVGIGAESKCIAKFSAQGKDGPRACELTEMGVVLMADQTMPTLSATSILRFSSRQDVSFGSPRRVRSSR